MKKGMFIMKAFAGILMVLITFSSCSSSKSVVSKKQTADSYFASGDYASALKTFEEIIASYESAGNEKECPVYTKAAEAAWNLGQKEKAIEYFKKAEYSPASLSDETFLGLAKYYREKNNLSKELMALQDYLANFPEGKNAPDVKKKLFELYVESENYDKALDLWPEIQNIVEGDTTFILDYFKVNEALDNKQVCDSIAPVILDFNPNNMEALEWEAKKYYDRAEALYQKEMKYYEKNRTTKQYSRLLKALKSVTADFKTSLKYFTRLYEIKPDTKYASYLANIYNRLDNKAKAEYYKKKAGM
jgi:tetratricopeptide (TPR) repeat protein